MQYTPFESMDRLFEQLRRDMAEWREHARREPWEGWDGGRFGAALNLDLAEHDDEYVLTVDLPGFETDEIDLRYDDGELFLAATHEEGDESPSRRRSVSERVSLPKDVVAEEITASYHNGVLEVRLPIVEDAEDRGREIRIE